MNEIKPAPVPLHQFKDFEEVTVTELPPPDFHSELRHFQSPVSARLETLLKDCKGIKYDDYELPNLAKHTQDHIPQYGYKHGITGDTHFLIPPQAQ
jgi:hypothetical protein